MVQRILLASVVAGAVAGIALTALQSGAVIPLLLAAETYEAAGEDPELLPHRHGELVHSHARASLPHEHDGQAVRSAPGDPGPIPHRHGELTHSHAFGDLAHQHEGQALVFGSGGTAPATGGAEDQFRTAGHGHGGAWSPEDGIARTFWTAVSNVATAIGFALLIVAIFAWRGNATWRQGLLWGAAGFFVFFVNPAIGLRPEIPGTFAAGLLDRQLWWLLAVACSAAGVGLLLLAPRVTAKVAGAVLLAVPHLAGAPHPEVSGGLAPETLADSFVVAAVATNAVFWLVLGLAASVAFTRFSRS